LAVVVALGWTTTSRAQVVPTDPVQGLRQALQAPAHDLPGRDRTVKSRLVELHGLTEMAQALMLREWRDEDVTPQVAAGDRANRTTLLHSFEQEMRTIFAQGDPSSQVAAAELLAAIGASARGTSGKESLGRRLGPDLVELIAQGRPQVRPAAVRALGRVRPDWQVAQPALNDVIGSVLVEQRLAAADALVSLVEVVTELTARSRNASGVDATRGEVIAVGAAVVPVAGRGLSDVEPGVRARCALAIGKAVVALSRLVMDPVGPESRIGLTYTAEQLQREQAEELPLLLALKKQGPALARALSDGDGEVRVLIQQVLEEIACLRLHLLRRTSDTPPAGEADPLGDCVQPALAALVKGLSDPDLYARLTVLDTLEALGPTAAPVGPAVVRALADNNRFVRWAAARTLGTMSPAGAGEAVPALARLLSDADLNLRLAAAAALDRYGPASAAAVPSLIEMSSRDDVEGRIAALRVLAKIGNPYAAPAVPVFRAALADPDGRVRRLAAHALGTLGPAARDAVQELRQARCDPSLEVQKAAAAALVQIAAPGGEIQQATYQPR
jgi:HEAT repeat protein